MTKWVGLRPFDKPTMVEPRPPRPKDVAEFSHYGSQTGTSHDAKRSGDACVTSLSGKEALGWGWTRGVQWVGDWSWGSRETDQVSRLDSEQARPGAELAADGWSEGRHSAERDAEGPSGSGVTAGEDARGRHQPVR